MRLFSLLLLALTLALPINSADADSDLQAWYNGYNQKYFQHELPEAGSFSPPDVIIDFRLNDPDKMGVTVFGSVDGYIHMSFNPAFIKSTKTLRLTMLHEMCHIEGFVEDVHELDHGPKWQGCMHRLANQGAFEELW